MRVDKRVRAKKPETFTVSFRLAPTQVAQLEERASTYEMSVHEYARRLVLEVLDDAERERIRDEVKALRGEVSKLREGLATSLESILLNLTEASEDDIRRFVANNLRR